MSATNRDYYELLGVARDCDEATIKKAFRKLARELHPDVNSHDPSAEEKFKEAAEAYEVLSDSERRATYDRYGHDGLKSGGFAPNFDSFGSITDLFDAFFGGFGSGFSGVGGMRGAAQGGDVALQAHLTLAESATGVQREVAYEAVVLCEKCHGNGAEPGTPIETCPRCNGAGQLRAVQRTPFGQAVRVVACDTCYGDGRVPKNPCDLCDGRARRMKRVSVAVDVPAGISDGQRIRVSGRGHAGDRGGPPGDLYLQISVREDKRFVRDGDDLLTAVDVPAPRAALGTTIEVPTLLDGPVELEIPAGTQPHEVLVMRGGGMPSLRGGRSGDLRVVVNVVIPRKLNKEQRDLLERLAETITEDNLSSDEGVFSKLRRAFGGHA